MDDTWTPPSPSVYHTAVESGPVESPHPFRSPLTSNSPSTQDTDATPRASGYQAAFGLLVKNEAPRNASPIMLRRYVEEHALPDTSTPHLSSVPVLEATPIASRLRRSPRLSSTPKATARRSSRPNLTEVEIPLSACTTPRRSQRLSAARDATSSAASTASFPITSSSVAPPEPQIVHSPVMRPQLSGVAMSEPSYRTAPPIAVDQHVSSLNAPGCAKGAQAFMASDPQSKSDPGSAVLLDGLLRGSASARQARDSERYTNEFIAVCEDKPAPEEQGGVFAKNIAPTRAKHGTREVPAVVINNEIHPARYDIDAQPFETGSAYTSKMEETLPLAIEQAPASLVIAEDANAFRKSPKVRRQHKHVALRVPHMQRKARRNKRAGLKRAKKFGTVHRSQLILGLPNYGSGLKMIAEAVHGS